MRWTIDAILDMDNPWSVDMYEMSNLKLRAITESFTHHYQTNKLFRGLCEKRGITPEQITGINDLIRIPLISTRAFKSGLSLISVDEKDIVKIHHSSGTSGNQSRVPRDEVTMERFKKSLKKAIINVQGKSGYIAMLGPSPEELGNLAFANYAEVGCSTAEDFEYFLKDFKFDPDYIIDKTNSAAYRPVQIGGAPVLILDLARHILETGNRITSLTGESCVTSAGGFKDRQGEAIPRDEFDAIVMQAFGVEKSNIRDAYAMTELNGMMAECSANLKHVPPWIHLTVRDPADITKEVPAGVEGLPGFLDPSAHSYPGFIIADDMVRVVVGEHERCACGRPGPCIAPSVRRAEGAESKGCGRQIDELRSSR